jgi:hypothetical protein
MCVEVVEPPLVGFAIFVFTLSLYILVISKNKVIFGFIDLAEYSYLRFRFSLVNIE